MYDPETKRKRWVGSYPTLREARAAERDAVKAPTREGSEDCASFAERWVDDYARPAAATQRTNRYAVAGFIEDFRGQPLTAIDRPTARAWALRNPVSNARVVRFDVHRRD